MEKFTYEMIRSYQTFVSVEAMDEAVRGFLYLHKPALSAGTIEVLKFIWKHSIKVIGVSFAKYETIAQETNLSRRTVIRSVQALELLGIIKKVPTARMNGKQGVNLIVIQPFETITDLKNKMSPLDVTQPVTPIKAEKKQRSLCENNPLIRKHLIHVEELTHQVPQEDSLTIRQLDTSFLPPSIHKDFVKTAKPFFKAVEIYQLWNRVLLAHQKSKLQQPLELVIETVISALKQAIFRKKLGKIHTTFEGYFYQIISELFRAEHRKEIQYPTVKLFLEVMEN